MVMLHSPQHNARNKSLQKPFFVVKWPNTLFLLSSFPQCNKKGAKKVADTCFFMVLLLKAYIFPMLLEWLKWNVFFKKKADLVASSLHGAWFTSASLWFNADVIQLKTNYNYIKLEWCSDEEESNMWWSWMYQLMGLKYTSSRDESWPIDHHC